MERRRIEMQIRAILVPYRIELRRRDPSTMQHFRVRARSLLAALDEEVAPYPDLARQLQEAGRELGDGAD